MKKIVIAVVVLVLALLVAPWGVGKLAEERLNENLDWMVQKAPYLKIVERKWTGGWFRSEQVVTIEAFSSWIDAMSPKAIEDAMKKDAADAARGVEPGEPGEPAVAAAPDAIPPAAEMPADAAPKINELMRFTLRNEVLHGPVLGLSGFGIARVNSHLVMSEDTKNKITEIFGSKEPLELSTRIEFLGGATTTVKSEGRTIKEGKTEITWDTFKIVVGASRMGDSFDIKGKLPKVEFTSLEDKMHVVMNDMTMDGDARRVRGDLYDGVFNFRIATLSAMGSDNDKMEIVDVHYVTDVATKDGFTTMGSRFGTGPMKSPQFSAVGVEFKEVHFDLSMRHLHAETLEKLVAEMKTMFAKPLTPALQPELMFAPFKEQGAELLKYDPEFSIDRIGIVTPEGDGYLKGVIKLNGATAEDFADGSKSLIGKIHADLTIDVSEKMIQKFPNGSMAAGGAVDSGYAERKGDRLICRIIIADGALTVNGKPQAIPGLGGPPPGTTGEEIRPAE